MRVQPKKKPPQLGVNIDHVATLRQQRRGDYPDPFFAALDAVRGGAAQITLHLREDRRHIQDRDLPKIRNGLSVPMNLEMSLDPGIARIAVRLAPDKVCIVPEKRRELTTEGGLDVLGHRKKLARVIPRLKARGIGVSLFVDPEIKQVRAAVTLGADAVEIHTGQYAEGRGRVRLAELERIKKAARAAREAGLKVHAGHGLDLENVGAIARIPEIEELNIGYAIVCHAVFVGMKHAVRAMKRAIRDAL